MDTTTESVRDLIDEIESLVTEAAMTPSPQTYEINAADRDTPYPWMDLCTHVEPGAQDSDRCRFTVTTEQPVELVRALQEDPAVLEWEVVR